MISIHDAWRRRLIDTRFHDAHNTQVVAAGVNPVAWKLRKGMIKAWPQELPIVPGWDAAGVVEAVGPNCGRLKIGDAVFAYTRPAWDMAEAHPESAGEKIGNGPSTFCVRNT